MSSSKISEKERKEQLRALREELETKIEEDLEKEGLIVGARSPRPEDGETPPLRRESDPNLSGKRILEALLFASSKPLTVNEIQKIVGAGFPRSETEIEGRGNRAPTIKEKEIQRLVEELRDEYHKEDRSFEIIEIAGGWQIVTKKAYAVWLARLELQKKIRQASQSALETLAILAYKQPVTRAEIEQIRGVDVSAVISTLLERGFIKIVGKKEVAGRPFLYGTTEKFLEHFGLKSIGDLPPIQEIKTLIDRAVKKEELIGESRGGPTCPPNESGNEPEGQTHGSAPTADGFV